MFSQACVILLSTVGVCLWVRGGVPLGPGGVHPPGHTHTVWTHTLLDTHSPGDTHPLDTPPDTMVNKWQDASYWNAFLFITAHK